MTLQDFVNIHKTHDLSTALEQWSYTPAHIKTDSTTMTPTLNNMGVMLQSLDTFSRAFISDSVNNRHMPSLDIGAAYGITTIPAIAAGATMIANDIEPKHLDILKENVPIAYQSRLQTIPGRFPYDINLPNNSIHAILISRLLHFFSPQELTDALQTTFQWLAPGGRIYIICETPFVGLLKSFIPVFEQRRSSNQAWPGYIASGVRDYICLEEFKEQNPDKAHLLDIQTLSQALLKTGFLIKKAEYMARTDWPEALQYDGRESCGIIAQKPY